MTTRSRRPVEAAAGALGAASVLLAGCSGDASGEAEDDGGGRPEGASCVNTDGIDLCAVVEQDQVVVETTATGASVELMSAGNDPFNTFMGEGELLQAGTPLQVVCAWSSTTGSTTRLGVVLPDELDLDHAEPDRFAPGRIDGASWATIAFVSDRGVDDAPAVLDELDSALSDRFDDEVSLYSSCDDDRVVMTSLARSLVTGE